MIRVSCPKCKAILQVEDKHAGQVIACSNCKTSLRLPPAPPSPPASSPPVSTSNTPEATTSPFDMTDLQQAQGTATSNAKNPKTTVARIKTAWHEAKTPIKAAIIGGTSVMVLSCFLCCGIFGLNSLRRSHDGTAKKSYTQAVLDLDPAKQKEYGVVVPKGAKALYTPRSVEDFVQSLTLFKNTNCDVIDTKSDFGKDYGKVSKNNGVEYRFQAWYRGGMFIKNECWDTIYGPRQIKTVTWIEPRIGGGLQDITRDHWTVQCTNETVLVRGYNPKAPEFSRTKKDELQLDMVYFNTTFESICPRKGDNGIRNGRFGSYSGK